MYFSLDLLHTVGGSHCRYSKSLEKALELGVQPANASTLQWRSENGPQDATTVSTHTEICSALFTASAALSHCGLQGVAARNHDHSSAALIKKASQQLQVQLLLLGSALMNCQDVQAIS